MGERQTCESFLDPATRSKSLALSARAHLARHFFSLSVRTLHAYAYTSNSLIYGNSDSAERFERALRGSAGSSQTARAARGLQSTKE